MTVKGQHGPYVCKAISECPHHTQSGKGPPWNQQQGDQRQQQAPMTPTQWGPLPSQRLVVKCLLVGLG